MCGWYLQDRGGLTKEIEVREYADRLQILTK
jgi:hypothetical protein